MAFCKSCGVGRAVRKCWCVECDPGPERDADFDHIAQQPAQPVDTDSDEVLQSRYRIPGVWGWRT